MKKLFFFLAATLIVMPLSALATVNGGVNSYLFADGHDVAAQCTVQDVVAPGFVLDTEHGAVVGVWNGMSAVSQYTDYVRGPGFVGVNTGTDAGANAGYPGVADASGNNSTAFQMPGVIGNMDNSVDLSATFGGSANGSSSSSVLFIQN